MRLFKAQNFVRVFLSYLITMCVLLCLVGGIALFAIRQGTRQRVGEECLAGIKNSVNKVDTLFNSIETIAIQTALMPALGDIVTEENPHSMYNYYRLKEEMRKLQLPRNVGFHLSVPTCARRGADYQRGTVYPR